MLQGVRVRLIYGVVFAAPGFIFIISIKNDPRRPLVGSYVLTVKHFSTTKHDMKHAKMCYIITEPTLHKNRSENMFTRRIFVSLESKFILFFWGGVFSSVHLPENKT